MENNSASTAMCKIKSFCKSLCGLRMKKSYSLDISIYNSESDSQNNAGCSHSFKGDSDHSVVKMLAAGMLIMILCYALCAMKSFMKCKCK